VGGDKGGIASIDASTNRIVADARLDEPYACCVTVGGGSAWVAGSKSLIQLSPAGHVVRRIKVRSDNIGNVSFSAPYVWATADSTGELLRIDTRTGDLRTFHFGNGLVGVAASKGTVAVDAMPLQGNVTAGLGPKVLRIGLPTDWLHSTDPAMTRSPRGNAQWQWHLHDATCAWLYRAPPDGKETVRELAGVPSRSSDGLTWTIPVRRTLKFAPPASRFVTAEDVRATIVRALTPQLRPQSPAAAALHAVVGLRAFQRGATPDIIGVTVEDDAVVIRTTRQVHDLPSRLALPYFCILPAGMPAPPGGIPDRLPTAGPYYVSARGNTTVLRRNPGYRGPRPRRLDGIVFSLSVDGQDGGRRVGNGSLDLLAGSQLRVAGRVGCRTTRPGVEGLDIGSLCLRSQ
jgi:hypothetical protein